MDTDRAAGLVSQTSVSVDLLSEDWGGSAIAAIAFN